LVFDPIVLFRVNHCCCEYWPSEPLIRESAM
jgi:hypothetical protein